MNRILITLILALFANYAFAQDEVAAVEKAKEEVKNAMNEKKDRLIVNFSYDRWLFDTEDFPQAGTPDFKQTGFSRGLEIYMMYDQPIKKSAVSIAPGIGFSTSNIFHNAMIADNDSTSLSFTTYTDDQMENLVKKNKVSLNYVEVPLELRIRSKPGKNDKRFKVAMGFKFGVRVDAHTKVKQDLGDQTKVFKEKKFDGFNVLRYGPTFRIGYSAFNLFAFYSVSNIIKEDAPAKINQLSIGISINGL